MSIDMSVCRLLLNSLIYQFEELNRLLISQYIVEKIPILSIDLAFEAYPIERLW
jgi:PIN domain nuclease of toxin-antitoxin system